ncbi:hypothetical protein GGS23DRAFT_600444 [Durotheca rogersii]|uniref:uncharacterized protein n=1 Tax=Durotheca rogersii TaxID=419775 RepID=UPI00221FFC08|nr:uncharacterized protein GGS23DRAFT_600444 [Durotheca rogersii]KAI5859523.1 hypothetical protein GGS23DRAFT_600444 [Durotheca rogersii]
MGIIPVACLFAALLLFAFGTRLKPGCSRRRSAVIHLAVLLASIVTEGGPSSVIGTEGLSVRERLGTVLGCWIYPDYQASPADDAENGQSTVIPLHEKLSHFVAVSSLQFAYSMLVPLILKWLQATQEDFAPAKMASCSPMNLHDLGIRAFIIFH